MDFIENNFRRRRRVTCLKSIFILLGIYNEPATWIEEAMAYLTAMM
jgi:hypothetical protein